jgi:hypothetical protein
VNLVSSRAVVPIWRPYTQVRSGSVEPSGGLTVLWFLVRLVGAAPFEDGLRALTWPAVVAAGTALTMVSFCPAAGVFQIGRGWRLAHDNQNREPHNNR